MERSAPLTFGVFRIDTEKKRLWRGEQEVPLRQTAVAVLQVLVENAPHLVTKEYLLKQVWPGAFVSNVVVRVCIRDIRHALGDDAKEPQYVETIGPKGYRFIGQIDEAKALVPVGDQHGVGFEYIVGRGEELAQLEEWAGKARRGHRQIVFVTGEPGIGKTTLVELLLARLRRDKRVKVGRGQCFEQYGGGEPYLPILEALGRMCREPGGAPVAALLSRYAPTWMIQMPSLLSSAETASLQQRIQGANQQRMLREMADALEALTNEGLFVLVLEDLHWSDNSTLEFLSYLAQRQEHLRFMVIGTYRPADLTTGHLLKKIKREMHVRRQCEELPLALLNLDEVATYMRRRLPEVVGLPGLSNLVHRRTEGNALFMVNMVNMLQGQMVKRNGHFELPVNVDDLRVPESLQQVIEEKIDRLSADDRQILEAGSVEGREFSAVAVAAALGREPLELEERCADLIRQSQFIQETDTREWPDGTITARYEFIHALYHEVSYNRLTPGRRAQFHRRIGERLEQGYGNRIEDLAAELALHFERGRDFPRAVRYLQQAADQAAQRFAYPESVTHLTKALELLQTFSDTPERKQLELKCQISLGVMLTATKGYAALEVAQAYGRARDLCQQIGQTPQLAPVLRGLAAFYYIRAELATARELGEQLLLSAQARNDEELLLEAHFSLGGTLFSLGELTSALHHLNLGQRLYDPQKHNAHALVYGQDPGVACLSRASQTLWLLGYPDQALTRNQEALALAQHRAHPYSSGYALIFSAILHQLRGEPRMVQQQAETALRLASEHGFPIWKSMGEILRGWGIAVQGETRDGIALIQRGIALWHTAGAEVSLPYYLSLLAETYEKTGDFHRGLEVLDQAFSVTSRTDDHCWQAELYRLKGELLLQQFKVQGSTFEVEESSEREVEREAEGCFLKAIDITRKQQAKSLELRAATSLARLWRRQGREADACQGLTASYGRFREGFLTRDLQQAHALLEELHADITSTCLKT